MSSRNVKYFSLYLLLLSVTSSHSHATDSTDAFAGFSKGFLNKKSSIMPEKEESSSAPQSFGGLKSGFLNSMPQPKENDKEPDKPAPSGDMQIVPQFANNYSAALALFDQRLDENREFSEASTTETLWMKPVFISPEARQAIYKELIKPSSLWIDEIEENFLSLSGNNEEQRKAICESLKFFRNVLLLYIEFQKDYFNSHLNQPAPEKPAFSLFIMQNLVHWVIQTKFDYMNSLPPKEHEEFEKQFITSESDSITGEFILTGWDPRPEFAKIRYFQQTLKNKQKVYRLCYAGIGKVRGFNRWVPIEGDENLSYYAMGEIVYFTKSDPISLMHTNGFILDKNLNLFEKEGLVFSRSWRSLMFSLDDQYHLCTYKKHPILDEMFLSEIALFGEDNVPSLLKPLLDSVGGVKGIETRKLIFIPTIDFSTDTTVSPSIARWALPYLLEFKEEVQQNADTYVPAQIAWIDETIEGLKTILVEEACATEDEALEKEIANEIAEKEIQQELENKTSALSNQIKVDQDSIKETGEMSKTLRKQAKQKAKKRAKDKIVATIDRELIRQKRKEKALARIEKEYTRKVALKRNFSTNDVRELVGEMVKDLAPIGIETTGAAHATGSHAAVQVIDKDSGNTTRLGIAARPQKQGYQSGTVKTIIKDMIQKISTIVRKKKD